MNVLQSILTERRTDVEEARRRIPLDELKARASRRIHHGLAATMAGRRGTCVIAEMKKASPSSGLIRGDYAPADTARALADAGATAISVLTEPRRFLGSEQHLIDVRAAVSLPVLRKDFIFDPYQIHESAAWGADVVLLIVAALDEGQLPSLYAEAMDLGLDVIAEAHTRGELERALRLEKAIVGVNSRNLKSLKTDLSVARELAKSLPPGRQAIAESGIRTRRDIEELEAAGYSGFLVGEALMREGDPCRKLRELLGHG